VPTSGAGASWGRRRAPRPSPHTLDVPALRRRLELVRVAAAGEDGDVDQVEDATEGLVRPGVHRDVDRVFGIRERQQAVDRERRGDGQREQLLRVRRASAGEPLEPVVHLDEERQPGAKQRPPVVERRVVVDLLERLEVGREQRRLDGVGVRRHEVDVAQRAQRRVGVVRCHLRPLHEHHRAGVPADLLEQRPGAQRAERGEPLLVRELRRDLTAAGAQVARAERPEPVREQPLGVRPGDEPVERIPRIPLAHRRIVVCNVRVVQRAVARTGSWPVLPWVDRARATRARLRRRERVCSEP
jgi:hypothetical protein